MQMTAKIWLDHKDELSFQEQKVIGDVMDLDKVEESYSGKNYDEVKKLFNYSATDQQLSAYKRLWLQLFIRYPLSGINALFGTAGGFFTPTESIRVYYEFPTGEYVKIQNSPRFTHLRADCLPMALQAAGNRLLHAVCPLHVVAAAGGPDQGDPSSGLRGEANEDSRLPHSDRGLSSGIVGKPLCNGAIRTAAAVHTPPCNGAWKSEITENSAEKYAYNFKNKCYNLVVLRGTARMDM